MLLQVHPWCTGEGEMDGQNLPGVQERERDGQNLPGVQERKREIWMDRTYLVYRREGDGQNLPGVQERERERERERKDRTYLVYRKERERERTELTWCTGEREREKGQNLRGVQKNANRTREIKPSTEFTRKLASLPTNSVTTYAETITGTCGKTSKCATYSVT